MSTEKKETIWTRNFIVLCVMNFVGFLGQTAINSLMQIHMDNLQASATVTGVVIGISSGVALLMRPVAGSIIDGASKKFLLQLCVFLYAVAIFGYSISGTIFLTIVFRVVFGLGMGFFGAVNLAMATESLPKSKIASGIGIFSLMTVAGQAIGPMICIGVAEKYGVSKAFLLAGTFSFMGFLLGFLLKYPKQQRGKIDIRLSGAFAREAMLPGILFFLLMATSSSITSFIYLFAADKGVPGVARFFLVNAIILVIVRPIVGKISDRYGVLKTLLPSLAIFAVMLLLMPQMKNEFMLFVMSALYSLGYGTAFPSMQALCMKLTPEDKRGAGTNTFYLFSDLGLFVGPVVAGWLKDAFGFDTMYVCMVSLLVISAVILFVWKKKDPSMKGV
ncbi:MAG: MFS transporter [Firmicutes bacterium]|nr:MFS transporter [Bacillota bacterium]